MKIETVTGNLLDQDVEVIVNPWNRNILPWWILIPKGVSGAIKKKAGYQPYRELARHGPIPLGGAVETTAGLLPYKKIIHVAGINIFWVSTRKSIADSVVNAMMLVIKHGYASVAFPLIGGGTGGKQSEQVLHIIQETLSTIEYPGLVRIVVYKKN